MKNLTLLTLLVLISFGAYSQNRKFSFALNGGTNLSIPFEKEFNPYPEAITYSRVRTNQPNFGYFAEAEIQFQLNERIIPKWTIGYQFTQNKYEYGPDGFRETGNFKMSGLYNSLSLDHLFSKTNLYIGVGLFHKFLLTTEEEGEYEGDWITAGMLNNPNGQVSYDPLLPLDVYYDHINDIKRHEFGLLMEAGKYFKLSDKIKLNSFLRYNQSLVQILPDNFNMKHYSMYLSLGVGLVY